MKFFENILEYGIKIYFGMLCLGILLFMFRKKSLKAPGRRGFKNIRLKFIHGIIFDALLDFEDLVRGLLVIGGAGSGKTNSIGEPLVRMVAKRQLTGVVYDFKFPALASVFYDQWLAVKDPNVKPYYICFHDLCRSNRFNVFKIVPNTTYALEYTNSLMSNLLPESIKNPNFFTQTAGSLLTGSIVYFYRNKREFCTLPHITAFLLNSDIKRIVEVLSSDEQAADIVAPVRSGLSSEKQTAGVISTLQNALSPIANENVFWVLSGDDFDLKLNDPQDPKILILGNMPSLPTAISPLISLTITAASKLMNEKGRCKSVILLEEGPTLFIPNFETIPATGRENLIASLYFAQDVYQMEDRYGEKKAEILMGVLSNQFYGKVSNPKTAEKIVKLFDKDDALIGSHSSTRSTGLGNQGSTGRNESPQLRERVTMTHIRDLDAGQFIATTTSKRKDFKAIFPKSKPPEFVLPEITYVTDEMVYKNYQKIKNDVRSLFQ